jgi:hypothetical protein
MPCQELRQYGRNGFIKFRSATYGQNGCFSAPTRRKILLPNNRKLSGQVIIVTSTGRDRVRALSGRFIASWTWRSIDGEEAGSLKNQKLDPIETA